MGEEDLRPSDPRLGVQLAIRLHLRPLRPFSAVVQQEQERQDDREVQQGAQLQWKLRSQNLSELQKFLNV